MRRITFSSVAIAIVTVSMVLRPSPATVRAGQTVVWHNVDAVTLRVVLNDGEV